MGLREVVPHLVVAGASDAIEFYQKAFGAVEHFRMPGPDGEKLWHAELGFGPAKIFLTDEFPEMCGSPGPNTLGGTPVVIHLGVENCDSAFEQAVAAGAVASMPPMDMFWGDRYAQVTDPFGHKWSLSHSIKAMSPEEMAAGAAEAAASWESKS